MLQSDSKKISIIIPYYNREEIIHETIQSVLDQTYQNFEVIIIDDGSKTELTQEMILDTTKVSIFRQDNQGQTVARNNGARKATGEYLLFLDSDDIISPTYIEKCIHILDTKPDIGIVYSKASFFGTDNKSWKLPEFSIHNFLIENCIYVSAIHRREDFMKAGGFDETLSFFEDWELWISIIKNGSKVYRIPEELFHYRKDIDQNSITDNGNKDTSILDDNFQIIYNKHQDFYTANNFGFYKTFKSSKYKEKYYNQWFKRLFYNFKKKKS